MDTTWNPSPNGSVHAIAIDSGGNVFVGGQFTTIGGFPRNRIAKVSSSGVVDLWNANADEMIWTLTLDANGNLYVGGNFNTIGGQPRNQIARLSTATGTADPTWNPNASSSVLALALGNNGTIYAGGGFVTIGGQSRNGLAKLSTTGIGSADPTWNPNVVGVVRSLALDASGNLFIGMGNFGVPPPRSLYKVSATGTGSVDPAWNPGVSGGSSTVETILPEANGNLYVGGGFTSIGASARRGFARLLASGSVDTAWNPNADGVVYSSYFGASGSVCAAGGFASIGGQARSNIGCLTTNAANAAPAFTSPALTTFTVGSPGTFTVTASGSPSPTLALASGTIPGMTFNASTGTLSGTPTAAGTFTMTFTATNSVGTASQNFVATVVAAATQPPSCTVTATPNTFIAGTATNVTLAASCTNSPTSYSWSASFGAPAVTGSGSNVTAAFPAGTAAGTYSYSLSATNASGTAGAVVQIVVTSSTAVPACTLTAAPTTISTGTANTVTLTASCTGSPTSFTWTSSAGAPAVSGAGGTVTAFFATTIPAGTYTYSVRGTNAAGSGTVVNATVVVNVPAATPVCVLNGPAYYVVGQAAATLSASCSPAATSYVWTGGTCASTTGPTCVVSPPVTTTYSVAGRNNNGTGAAAGKTLVVNAQSFPLSVVPTITPTSTSATVQVQVPAQDLTPATRLYVFAHVPANKVTLLAVEGSQAPKRLEKADAPGPCVLAQILESKQLIGVTAASMQAYFKSAQSAQNQSEKILDNIPTPNLEGATIFVGYGTTATLMFANGTFQGAFTVAGASQCNTTLLSSAVPKTPDALTGQWYNKNESGWGVHFTQRHGVVFAAMYSYDSAGNPKWYVASSCGMGGTVSTSTGTCTGQLYEVSGPAFFGTPFNAAAVRPTLVGSLQMSFQDANNGLMSYSINAQGRTVALARQVFASGPMPPAIDYSDLWFNPEESGWGLGLTQQYGIMFLAWYVYDGTGKPFWYVVPSCGVSGSSCSGDLYRTTGPPLGPSFDPNRVTPIVAGTVSLTFIDANNATLVYTVNGVREVKFITRQVF